MTSVRPRIHLTTRSKLCPRGRRRKFREGKKPKHHSFTMCPYRMQATPGSRELGQFFSCSREGFLFVLFCLLLLWTAVSRHDRLMLLSS
jgi:hypothetical protein